MVCPEKKSGVKGKLYKASRGIYDSVIACVRDRYSHYDYFDCPRGVKQGCLLNPLMFSFFINELDVVLSKTGKHGIQLIPGAIEIFLLLFADDVILLSNTIHVCRPSLWHPLDRTLSYNYIFS